MVFEIESFFEYLFIKNQVLTFKLLMLKNHV